MTPIQERIATMRRIVDAAGGRNLTKSQLEDFQEAVVGFKSLAEDLGPEVLSDLAPALKSGVDGFETLVGKLEAWSARHNGGRSRPRRSPREPNGLDVHLGARPLDLRDEG